MSPSLLYATAACLEGCSFVNGGSQNTLCGALEKLAAAHQCYVLGTDFKVCGVGGSRGVCIGGGVGVGNPQLAQTAVLHPKTNLTVEHKNTTANHTTNPHIPTPIDPPIPKKYKTPTPKHHSQAPYTKTQYNIIYIIRTTTNQTEPNSKKHSQAGQTKFKTAAVEYVRALGLKPTVIASSNHLGG